MKVLFLLLGMFVFASPGYACLCAGEPTVEESFKDASAVFTGKFLRAEYRGGIKNELHEIGLEAWGKKGERYEVLVYIFQVDRLWKGAEAYEIVLITDNTRSPDGSESISDCGLGFQTGKEYLIYAYSNGEHISANACSRTMNIKRAASDIKRLNKLAKPVRMSS
jgi:hypothetical protein